jgi:hypothetical protein
MSVVCLYNQQLVLCGSELCSSTFANHFIAYLVGLVGTVAVCQYHFDEYNWGKEIISGRAVEITEDEYEVFEIMNS